MLWKLSHNYRGEKKVLWNNFHPWMSFIKKQCLSQTLATLKLSVHFIWVSLFSQLFPPLCDLMDCRTPGFAVLHSLPEFAHTHVHWVAVAIQPSHHLSSPFPPAFNLSQHQGLFQWVSSSHQVSKVLEFQLQDQFFQWIFRTDFI